LRKRGSALELAYATLVDGNFCGTTTSGGSTAGAGYVGQESGTLFMMTPSRLSPPDVVGSAPPNYSKREW